MKAAERGHIDCVKVLLEFGALVDLTHTDDGADCGDGYEEPDEPTAIYVAAKQGHFDIVKLLLETDPKAELNHSQYRSLYEACRQGHLETAKLLIEHDAELFRECCTYDTNALMEASKSGNAELIE